MSSWLQLFQEGNFVVMEHVLGVEKDGFDLSSDFRLVCAGWPGTLEVKTVNGILLSQVYELEQVPATTLPSRIKA